MTDYKQLCVLEGTIVGDENVNDFETYFKEKMDVRVKYMEEIETLPTPDEEGTGGRNDVFFYVHNDDIMRFAVPRMLMNIRWWEDVLGNGNGVLYPESCLAKYPKTW